MAALVLFVLASYWLRIGSVLAPYWLRIVERLKAGD